jgi:hypothetical protein
MHSDIRRNYKSRALDSTAEWFPLNLNFYIVLQYLVIKYSYIIPRREY